MTWNCCRAQDGQEITFSDEEVPELIDQLDDMMGELALIDMPSVQEDKPSTAELYSFFLNYSNAT